MASTPTLWTIPLQPIGKAIRGAAVLAGVDFKLPADGEYTHFQSNLLPAFKAKFPHGKIPAWEEGDFLLAEGVAIARYVAGKAPDSKLLGTTPQEAAQIDMWIHLADGEIDPYSNLILNLCKGATGYSKPVHTLAAERQLRALNTLNSHLEARTFFVGERISLADLIVAAVIVKATWVTIDQTLCKKLPHLIRHYETVINHPKLKDIFGPAQYPDKPMQYVAPKKEEKKKEEKPKAEKKKVEKKPQKEEAEEEEEEPAVPAEPKKKNPLDDLPKSSFNLEDWKRAYSNMDTRGAEGALEWFYKNYDPAGFSIHRVSFRYPTELTMTFMSSNQIGGFFNRLEASRKYLFASVGVLGKQNDSFIEGVMVCRGDKIEPVVDCAPDWESYAFSPLDIAKEEDKKFFEGAMAWDLVVDGKEWVDGKNFK